MVTLEAWARKEQLIHETQKAGAKNKRTAVSGVNWKQVLSSSHQHHELSLAQVPSNTGKAAQEQREGRGFREAHADHSKEDAGAECRRTSTAL